MPKSFLFTDLFLNLQQCSNVVSAALVNFLTAYSFFGTITIDRNHKVSRHLWSGFFRCIQAGFSPELRRIFYTSRKINNSEVLFTALAKKCWLCLTFATNDTMKDYKKQAPGVGSGNLVKECQVFLTEMLKNKKTQSPLSWIKTDIVNN